MRSSGSHMPGWLNSGANQNFRVTRKYESNGCKSTVVITKIVDAFLFLWKEKQRDAV